MQMRSSCLPDRVYKSMIQTMSRKTKRQAFTVSGFALLAALLLMTVRVTVVRGDSMLPSYRDGQIVFVNRFLALNGPLRRGDVVLVRTANDVLIKRVAYLPGDTIDLPEVFAFRRVRDYFEVERRTVGSEC